MKLSDIKKEHARDREGEWFHFRGSIYLRVRRLGDADYQRAVRLAQLSHPASEGEGPDAKAAREEAIGLALVPAVAEHLLLDWYGVDADSAEPIPLASILHLSPVRIVAVVDDVPLEVVERDHGTPGRVEGENWIESCPYSPAVGSAALADPECADLLQAVRIAAQILEVRRIERDARSLGKRKSTSAGTSDTGTRQRP